MYSCGSVASGVWRVESGVWSFWDLTMQNNLFKLKIATCAIGFYVYSDNLIDNRENAL
jgi:hypothetical protein